jgi:quercetin dioxygenase-like cupin family protein
MNAADTPQPFVTDYEDAPAYWSIGILWNVLISADQSFGNFTLMDQTMPEGAGPPSHMHERMHEGFYIIEGQITYSVGPDDDKITAGPGAAVWIPPGTPHAFTVTSGPARALNFYTPGGFDDQFAYLATPATAVESAARFASHPARGASALNLALWSSSRYLATGLATKQKLKVSLSRRSIRLRSRTPWQGSRVEPVWRGSRDLAGQRRVSATCQSSGKLK